MSEAGVNIRREALEPSILLQAYAVAPQDIERTKHESKRDYVSETRHGPELKGFECYIESDFI